MLDIMVSEVPPSPVLLPDEANQDIHIKGYGLLHEGVPLLVEEDGVEGRPHSPKEGSRMSYTLSKTRGMPYLVDRFTLEYYMSYGHSRYEQGAPHDCCYSQGSQPCGTTRHGDSMRLSATPCYMEVTLTKEHNFSFSITTTPLQESLKVYNVLPSDCLDDTVSGPRHLRDCHVKRLYYTPDLIMGGLYVDGNVHIDTYLGSSGLPNHHLFYREQGRLTFYETVDISTLLTMTQPEDT